MVEVLPFKGLGFKPGNLKEIITEPYDKIPNDLQRTYYERSENNFIRLNLPTSTDPYNSAKKTLEEWRNNGTLKEDQSPFFYQYIEEFNLYGVKRKRSGLFAIVRLEDYDEKNIFRHERTFLNPKDDRLKMLRATQTDLEPILFLYDDVNMEVMKIIDSVDKENESDFVDENGTRHILKRFESPEITSFFKQKKLVIADGHHRYESALAYGKEMGFTGGTGYVMAVLVNKYDPGLVVIATHRVVQSGTLPAEKLLEGLKENFVIEEIDKREVLDPLRSDIIFYYKDHYFSLTPNENLLASLTNVEKLNASLLNMLIVPQIAKLSGGNPITYTRNASDAIRKVNDGEARYAFLLKPIDPGKVWEVAIEGKVMPEKSTDFFPKLASGLKMFRLN